MTEERASVDLPEMSEEVVDSQVTDGGVLLVTEEKVHYGLNAKGARIWELLPEFGNLHELCRELRDEYPEAAPDELRRDVLRALEDLADRGLVRWPEGEGLSRSPGSSPAPSR